MNFRKYSLMAIVSIITCQSMLVSAQALQDLNLESSRAVTPLLSPQQLNEKMKELKGYLDKVKRCLATGPCSQEELKQVRTHAVRLVQAITVVALVSLFAWKGVPWIKKKAKEQTHEAIKFVKAEFLEQVLDVLDEDRDREDPDIRKLKDKIKEKLKVRFKEAGEFTKGEVVEFVLSSLEEQGKDEDDERIQAIKEHFKKKFGEGAQFVAAKTREVAMAEVEKFMEDLKERFKRELDRLLSLLSEYAYKIPGKEELQELVRKRAGGMVWSLPGESEIVHKLKEWEELSKEKLKALFGDQEIQTKLAEFIDGLGKESHIIDFIKRLKDSGVNVDFNVAKSTRLGFPEVGSITVRYGPKEEEKKEKEEE